MLCQKGWLGASLLSPVETQGLRLALKAREFRGRSPSCLAKLALGLALVLVQLGSPTSVVGQEFDFGDAPDTSISIGFRYPTVLADDGARHAQVASPSLYLGGTSDANFERISISSTGQPGNRPSHSPSMSADGRFVAFHSDAGNLVDTDTNQRTDIFVRDRLAGTNALASVDSAGNQGNHVSLFGSISDDGRFVAFQSLASNLVPDDGDSFIDIFIHDRVTAETTRLTDLKDDLVPHRHHGPAGAQDPIISGDGNLVFFRITGVGGFGHDRGSGITFPTPDGEHKSVSTDGRWVVFSSHRDDLVSGDTNNQADVFVFDSETGDTSLVSVSTAGVQANGASRDPAISGDGGLVVFRSGSTNLDGPGGLFVRDRVQGTTTRLETAIGHDLAMTPNGRFVAFFFGDQDSIRVHDRQLGTTTPALYAPALAWQVRPAITDDGLEVAFQSTAADLLPGDDDSDSGVFVFREQYRIDYESDGVPSLDASGTAMTAIRMRRVSPSYAARYQEGQRLSWWSHPALAS